MASRSSTKRTTTKKKIAKKAPTKTAAQKCKEAHEKRQKEIAKVYADLAKELKRTIRMNDMIDAGYTRDTISHYFQSLGRLNAFARDLHPNSFFDIAISNLIHDKEFVDSVDDVVGRKKRFFITTAVTGCPVEPSCINSIASFCAKRDAACLVQVSSDPAHNWEKNNDQGSIDSTILDTDGFHLVLKDLQLNDNLYMSCIKLSAKQIDPVTGLTRIGQKRGSFIYASPKQRLKLIATSNNKLPRMAMTTGALTAADYRSENYMSQRTAYIAENDHVNGGLIVEIEDKKTFHFRQVQFDIDGSFVDLGVKYNADGTTESIASHFVLGDWHAGSTDPRMIHRCQIVLV
jgi:hypothetical protein